MSKYKYIRFNNSKGIKHYPYLAEYFYVRVVVHSGAKAFLNGSDESASKCSQPRIVVSIAQQILGMPGLGIIDRQNEVFQWLTVEESILVVCKAAQN